MAYKEKLSKIYANNELKSFFRSEIQEKTLSHAYIIEGADGSGKYTLAKSVCADLAADERLSELIMQDMAPDVVTVAPEKDKRSIGIGAVRSIKQDAFIIPGELDFKAYIIKYSDLMTAQAQNALLKLLEEPPSYVYFFLLCENSSSLLPTVRSRAPVVRTQLLSPKELEKYLLNDSKNREKFRSLDEGALEHVINVSGGSVGRAEAALDSEEEGDPKKVAGLLELLCEKKRGQIHLFVNSLSSKREELSNFLESFMSALRDITAMKQSGDIQSLFGYASLIAPMAKKFTVAQLISCYDASYGAFCSLAANMNVNIVKASFSDALCRAVNR